MIGRALSYRPLGAAFLALLIGLPVLPAEAGNVRIEGDRIGMNIGAQKGYGVRSAMERHHLFEGADARPQAYHDALKRLGPRLRGAKVIVREHNGGHLMGTIVDVHDINVLGLPVQITGRYCYSACTLFLGAKNVCVSPKTSFGFHKPYRTDGRRISEAGLRASIGKSASHYKPELREWWETKGSRSRNLIKLTGRDLARFGYRLCDAKNADG
jgi:hypothetical protein